MPRDPIGCRTLADEARLLMVLSGSTRPLCWGFPWGGDCAATGLQTPGASGPCSWAAPCGGAYLTRQTRAVMDLLIFMPPGRTSAANPEKNIPFFSVKDVGKTSPRLSPLL